MSWARWKPTKEQPWNLKRVVHLHRRAGFGATWAEIQRDINDGPDASIDRVLRGIVDSKPARFPPLIQGIGDAAVGSNNPERLKAWWLLRMLVAECPLREKLALMWHNHFATSNEKVGNLAAMRLQNESFYSLGAGKFGTLLNAVARSPAMLVWLDAPSNRKGRPNENLAREIMELFCLGEGNYSEQDIRELARCFTGWEVKREKFRFNRYQHDTGTKTILGETGEFGGEEGVAIVAKQPAAPLFIAMKLVKFFVMEEPEPTTELLAPLAQELRDNDLQVAPVVRRILSSNLFFSKIAIGRKVRSPVELAVGFLRALEGSTSSYELAKNVKTLGQGLLYPPSVKGWDGGRTWINSSTLLGRSNLIRGLLDSDKTRFGRESLPDYLRGQGAKKVDEVIDLFEETLFAVEIPSAARDRIRQLAGTGNDEAKLKDAVHALCTLPEFQLA